MTPRVYSYIRFSHARQAAGASTERQAAYAKRWADENGLQLDAELTMRDEGLSAYHQRHVKAGALGVFLRAVSDGLIAPGSVLVVEALDRLSRAEPLQAQAQLGSIINAGISVVTASDGKAYSRDRLKANPMDLVYSLLVMIRAHEESDTKSTRVRDAIRRQVEGWKAGTYRGLVSYGPTPSWLRRAGDRWEFVPERAEAVRLAVAMCIQGTGTARIAQALHERGLRTSDAPPTSGALVRLFAQPALMGDKHLQLDGTEHVLQGYYPPLLEPATWQALRAAADAKGRKAVRGEIPSILTGYGITTCGYCGSALKAQTMASKRRADGSLADGHRRLQCVRVNAGDGCPVPGSCSAAPIERAIIRYCSDVLNLQRLYDGDSAAGPRAAVAQLADEAQRIDSQLQRLTDALLTTESPPEAFVRRAKELEQAKARADDALRAAEAELQAAARAGTDGAHLRWRSIADGVEALDYDARMRARQLVADTFSQLTIWMQGTRPHGKRSGPIDVMLTARGGLTRWLRVQPSGDWVAGEEADSAG
jgi:DNA invertase Pin-like site-specific DNA recombinase